MIEHIKQKYDNLLQSELKDFQSIASLKNIMGVYIIYGKDSEVLYIGSTNKFHIRFGTDLKHETTHTFVRKSIKNGDFKDRHEVVSFLKMLCTFRIEPCETKREAEALEHIAIYSLNPKFNK